MLPRQSLGCHCGSKFDDMGCFPDWINRTRKTYSGFGGQAGSSTMGETHFPCCVAGSGGAA
eukprot:2859068-Pyramimonas_sp.AAC.1